VSAWSAVAVQDGPVGLLQRDVSSGRIAHAYVFAGAAGRVPLDAAVAFAAAQVCPFGGCGECDACIRVTHRAHPDVEIIEPAGMQLLVDQVRDAVRASSRRPVAAPRRVIIVEGADRMNPTAQNAFLKALEEPPPSTTIILLAPSPEALLDTVRSRCREVTFRTPRPDDVAALLVSQGIEPDEAARSARLAGDVQRASMLATDEDARALRSELVSRVVTPMRDGGEALEAAEWLVGKTRELGERGSSEDDSLKDWAVKEPKRVAADRVKRAQRRAEQDAIEASVDDIASVLRDLIVAFRDPDGSLMNTEARADIVRRAGELRPGADARIISALGEVEAARRRLRSNANVPLTLESIFLSLYRQLV
jgi:DNA polymerase-3 subunit delta'